MKRIIKVLLLFLLTVSIFVFPSYIYAASSSKSAVLTIYACGDAGSSASFGNSGHAWITLKNISSKSLKFLSYSIKPRETISLSKWSKSDKGEGGVYLNREQLVCGGTQPTSYSMKISAAQLKKIEKATPAESTYNTFWYNCTTYSTNMWNLVADRTHQISDGMFSIDIPGTVANKIASWNGARKAFYKEDSSKHWADVYHITTTGKLECVDIINIDPVSMSLGAKEKKSLTAFFKYSEGLNNKIKWKSSNTKKATVNSNGVVSGKGKGTATITASYGRLEAKCKVIVGEQDGICHTEEGDVWYQCDVKQNSSSNIRISIRDNKLFVEGKMKRGIDNRGYKKISGDKHIFMLSGDTMFFYGDGAVNVDQFLKEYRSLVKEGTGVLVLWLRAGKVDHVGFSF